MWIFAVVRFTHSGLHPSLNWTAGMVFLWLLLTTLWLSWFTDGSGYRLLFAYLGKAVLRSMVLSFPTASQNAPFSSIMQEYGRVFELDRNM